MKIVAFIFPNNEDANSVVAGTPQHIASVIVREESVPGDPDKYWDLNCEIGKALALAHEKKEPVAIVLAMD